MAKDITISKLCEGFEQAVIIDMGRKMVIVIKNNKGKIYPEKYYKQLLDGLNLKNFEDDTNGNE